MLCCVRYATPKSQFDYSFQFLCSTMKEPNLYVLFAFVAVLVHITRKWFLKYINQNPCDRYRHIGPSQSKFWRWEEQAWFHLIIMSILFEINCNFKLWNAFFASISKNWTLWQIEYHASIAISIEYNEQINFCIHHKHIITQKLVSALTKRMVESENMETLHSIHCIYFEWNKHSWKMIVAHREEHTGRLGERNAFQHKIDNIFSLSFLFKLTDV